MYVHAHVCMYVCMCESLRVAEAEALPVLDFLRMNRYVYYVSMYMHMYVCMYVCEIEALPVLDFLRMRS